MNAKRGLQVEDAAEAIRYAHLFCSAISGEEGNFSPIWSPVKAHSLRLHYPEDLSLVPPVPILVPPGERSKADTENDALLPHHALAFHLLYAGEMFHASFTLSRNGVMTMVDDTPVRNADAPTHSKLDGDILYRKRRA